MTFDGQELTFNRPMRYADLRAFQSAGEEFVDRVTAASPAVPPDWQELLPVDRHEATVAFAVHYWSADPTKISQLDALKLTRHPFRLESLYRAISERLSADHVAADAVTEAKKSLSETPSVVFASE